MIVTCLPLSAPKPWPGVVGRPAWSGPKTGFLRLLRVFVATGTVWCVVFGTTEKSSEDFPSYRNCAGVGRRVQLLTVAPSCTTLCDTCTARRGALRRTPQRPMPTDDETRDEPESRTVDTPEDPQDSERPGWVRVIAEGGALPAHVDQMLSIRERAQLRKVAQALKKVAATTPAQLDYLDTVNTYVCHSLKQDKLCRKIKKLTVAPDVAEALRGMIDPETWAPHGRKDAVWVQMIRSLGSFAKPVFPHTKFKKPFGL